MQENTARVAPLDPQTLVRDIRKTALTPDFWYPVARSAEVRRGKAHACSFAGEPIVLVRGAGWRTAARTARCR